MKWIGNSLATQLCGNYNPSLCAHGRTLDFLDWLRGAHVGWKEAVMRSQRLEDGLERLDCGTGQADDTAYQELSRRFQEELSADLSKTEALTQGEGRRMVDVHALKGLSQTPNSLKV